MTDLYYNQYQMPPEETMDRRRSFSQSTMDSSDAQQNMNSSATSIDKEEEADTIAELEKKVKPGSKCLVKFAYTATRADELDLYVGEVIVVAKAPPGGWWLGANLTSAGLGKPAWFPANFIELVPDEQPKQPKQPVDKQHKRNQSEPPISDDESKKKRFWQRKGSKTKIEEKSAKEVTSDDENEEMIRARSSSAPQSLLGSLKPKKSTPDISEPEQQKIKLADLRTQSPDKKAKTPSPGFAGLNNSGVLSMSRLSQHWSKPDKLDDSVLSETNLPSNDPLPLKITKKSWKEGVPEEYLQKLSSKEQKRQQVLWELFVTEGAYIRDLNMVLEVFMKPLSEKKIISLKNVDTIFSNLERIIQVNEEFFNVLEKLYEAHPTIDHFGSFFMKTCENFIVYTTYCSNNAKALQKINDLTTSGQNKAFANYLKEMYKKPITRHLDLSSYLIKPVQRICKYPLLLMEIIKNTPSNHMDRRNLEIALAKLQNVLMVVNEGVDGIQKIVEIQNSFAEKVTIVSPTRYLVREDHVSVLLPPPDSRQKPRELYLFNDILILTKKDWRDKNHLIEKAEIGNVKIFDVDPAKPMFEILILQAGANGDVLDSVRYLIICSAKAQKDQWLQAWKSLSNTVAALKKADMASAMNLTDSKSSASVNLQKMGSVTDSLSFAVKSKANLPDIPVQSSSSIDAKSNVQKFSESTNKLLLPQQQQKPNTSSFDLVGKSSVVKKSMASLASQVTDNSKNGRVRAHSFNESIKQHVAITQEIIDKHGMIVITKARSLTDLNPEEQEQLFNPQRSSVDIFASDEDDLDKSESSGPHTRNMSEKKTPMSTLGRDLDGHDNSVQHTHSVEEKLRAREKEVSTQNEKLADMKAFMDKLEKENKSLKDTLISERKLSASLADEKHSLQGRHFKELREEREKVSSLESQVVSLQSKLETSEVAARELEYELQNALNVADERQGEIESLKQALGDVNKALNTEQDKVSKKTAEVQETALKLRETSAMYEELVRRYDEKSREVEIIVSKMRSRDTGENSSDITTLREKVMDLEARLKLAASRKAKVSSMESVRLHAPIPPSDMRKSVPFLATADAKPINADLLVRLAEVERANAELLVERDQFRKEHEMIIRKDSMAVEIGRLNKKVKSLNKELKEEQELRQSLQDLRTSQNDLSTSKHSSRALFAVPEQSTWRDVSIDKELEKEVRNASIQTAATVFLTKSLQTDDLPISTRGIQTEDMGHNSSGVQTSFDSLAPSAELARVSKEELSQFKPKDKSLAILNSSTGEKSTSDVLCQVEDTDMLLTHPFVRRIIYDLRETEEIHLNEIGRLQVEIDEWKEQYKNEAAVNSDLQAKWQEVNDYTRKLKRDLEQNDYAHRKEKQQLSSAAEDLKRALSEECKRAEDIYSKLQAADNERNEFSQGYMRQLNESKAYVVELERQISVLQAEKNIFRDQNDALTKQMETERLALQQEIDTRTAKVQSALESFKEAKRNHEITLRQIESQLTEANNIIREKKNEIISLRYEKEQLLQICSDTDQLRQERRELQDKFNRELSGQEEKHSDELKQLNDKILVLQKDLKSKAEALGEVEKDSESLRLQWQKVKEKLEHFKLENENLLRDKENTEKLVLELKQQVREKAILMESMEMMATKEAPELQNILQLKLDHIKTELDETSEKLRRTQETSESQLRDFQKQKNDLSREIMDLKEQLNISTSASIKLQNQLAESNNAHEVIVAAQDKERRELQSKQEAMTERIQQLQGSCEKAKYELQRMIKLETHNQELSETLESTQTQLAKRDEEFNALRAELDSLDIKLKEKSKSAQHSRQKAEHIAEEAEKLRSKLKDFETRNSELEILTSELQSEIGRYRDEISELQKAHEQQHQMFIERIKSRPNYKDLRSGYSISGAQTMELHSDSQTKLGAYNPNAESQNAVLAPAKSAVNYDTWALDAIWALLSDVPLQDAQSTATTTKELVAEIERRIQYLLDNEQAYSVKQHKAQSLLKRIVEILELDEPEDYFNGTFSSALIAHLIEFKSEHEHLREDVRHLLEEYNGSKTAVESLRADYKAELEQMELEYKERLTAVSKKKEDEQRVASDNFNRQVTILEEKLRSVQEQLFRVTIERDAISNQLSLLQARFEQLQREKQTVENSWRLTQNALERKEAEALDAKSSAFELNSKFGLLERSKSVMEERINSANEAAQRQIVDLNARISQLTIELREMTSNRIASDAQIKTLNQQWDYMIKEKDQLEQAFYRLASERDELLREKQNRRAWISRQDYDALNEQCDSLQKELAKHCQLKSREPAAEKPIESSDQKEKEIRKLRKVIQDFQVHEKQLEEYYNASINNREKDLQMLRKEIDQLARLSQPEDISFYYSVQWLFRSLPSTLSIPNDQRQLQPVEQIIEQLLDHKNDRILTDDCISWLRSGWAYEASFKQSDISIDGECAFEFMQVLNDDVPCELREVIADNDPFYESLHLQIIHKLMEHRTPSFERISDVLKQQESFSKHIKPFATDDALLIWLHMTQKGAAVNSECIGDLMADVCDGSLVHSLFEIYLGIPALELAVSDTEKALMNWRNVEVNLPRGVKLPFAIDACISADWPAVRKSLTAFLGELFEFFEGEPTHTKDENYIGDLLHAYEGPDVGIEVVSAVETVVREELRLAHDQSEKLQRKPQTPASSVWEELDDFLLAYEDEDCACEEKRSLQEAAQENTEQAVESPELLHQETIQLPQKQFFYTPLEQTSQDVEEKRRAKLQRLQERSPASKRKQVSDETKKARIQEHELWYKQKDQQPALKSKVTTQNKTLIKNALSQLLAGDSQAKERAVKLLDASISGGSFLILLKAHREHVYRGLYIYDAANELALKIDGKSGTTTMYFEPKDVEYSFKYDSSSKSFQQLQSKQISPAVHAIVLK